MGLFDLFNKDKNQPQGNSSNSLYASVRKYNEYIVRFLGMQQQGNYSPISAYEKPNGEIVGFLYMMGEDNSYTLSASEVIDRMETGFEKKLIRDEINSYVILYHSQFANDHNHTLANSDDELKAITVAFHFKNGLQGKIGLPYLLEEDGVTYQGFSNFNQEENNQIFNTRLKENYDYFQDREDIKVPETENEIGLKIKKSNNLDLSNTWAAVFGFESYRQPEGSKRLIEHFSLALSKGTIVNKGNVSVAQLEYEDLILKGIVVNGNGQTILPVVKTNYAIDIVNKEINEWENVDNLEAIITGGGRDTFGLSYFATDYAENRERYLSKKSHMIRISGIAFVLDISNVGQSDGEVKYSENFTAYMPSNQLLNYACFDFIGEVENFRETSLLEDKSLKGYLMKVRLITNEEFKDFFTIDIYVAKENMRFRELKVGMKITGMVQLQGQIEN